LGSHIATCQKNYRAKLEHDARTQRELKGQRSDLNKSGRTRARIEAAENDESLYVESSLPVVQIGFEQSANYFDRRRERSKIKGMRRLFF